MLQSFVRFQISEEGSNRRKVATDAAGLKPAISMQMLQMIREMTRGHFRRIGDAMPMQVFDQIIKVALVGGKGRRGQPGFDSKPAQYLTNRLVEA